MSQTESFLKVAFDEAFRHLGGYRTFPASNCEIEVRFLTVRRAASYDSGAIRRVHAHSDVFRSAPPEVIRALVLLPGCYLESTSG
jgi:hypothetical protein